MGVLRGRKRERNRKWMRCPFPRGKRERERVREGGRERAGEVSSPWIVPAIIYFLSDRGDRLYGGCSVQAPGSGSLPGSAYVLPRARRPSLSRGTGTLKNIDNRANTGRGKMSMSKVLVIRFEVSIFRRSLDTLSLSLSLCLHLPRYFRSRTHFRTWTYFNSDP